MLFVRCNNFSAGASGQELFFHGSCLWSNIVSCCLWVFGLVLLVGTCWFGLCAFCTVREGSRRGVHANAWRFVFQFTVPMIV